MVSVQSASGLFFGRFPNLKQGEMDTDNCRYSPEASGRRNIELDTWKRHLRQNQIFPIFDTESIIKKQRRQSPPPGSRPLGSS